MPNECLNVFKKYKSARNLTSEMVEYFSAFYGYIRDGKYGIRIDETAANIVKQIFQRADEGWKIADIAKELAGQSETI